MFVALETGKGKLLYNENPFYFYMIYSFDFDQHIYVCTIYICKCSKIVTSHFVHQLQSHSITYFKFLVSFNPALLNIVTNVPYTGRSQPELQMATPTGMGYDRPWERNKIRPFTAVDSASFLSFL